MEVVAIIVGIVAIVALVGARGASSDQGPPLPASQVTAGTGGPAIQSLVEQPASTPGTPGSGSMSPTGVLPPVASSPIWGAPRPPVRVPINMASVERVRLSSGAYPVSPPTVGFNASNTAFTGQGTAPRPRVTFGTA